MMCWVQGVLLGIIEKDAPAALYPAAACALADLREVGHFKPSIYTHTLNVKL